MFEDKEFIFAGACPGERIHREEINVCIPSESLEDQGIDIGSRIIIRYIK